MRISRWLQLPEDTPVAAQLATAFYLAHLFCQGWIAASETFLALGLICWFVALYRRELSMQYHPLYFPLLVFVAASELSAAFAPRPLKSFLEVSELFTFFTFPLALSVYGAFPGIRRKAVTVLAALGIFQSAYGLFQYFVLSPHDVEHRITGTAAHVMTFSGIILPLSLLFVILFLDERRPLYFVAAATTSLALVLTLTRGAWIGWIAGFLTFIVVRRVRWAFLLVPLVILAATFAPMSIFARFVSSFDVKQSSNLDRIRMVQAGVEMVRDRPITGIGPGNIKETYPLYREPDAPRFKIPHLHNNVMQIAAERGILALGGYLLLIGVALRAFVRREASEPAPGTWSVAGLAIVVGLTCAGAFEFNFGDSEVLLHLLDLIALAIASKGALEVVPLVREAAGTAAAAPSR